MEFSDWKSKHRGTEWPCKIEVQVTFQAVIWTKRTVQTEYETERNKSILIKI